MKETKQKDKEKFFAQYWWQGVAYYSENGHSNNVGDILEVKDIHHLLLTKISDIATSDAVEVAKILDAWVDFRDNEEIEKQYAGGKDAPMDKATFVSYLPEMLFEDTHVYGMKIIMAYQYLQSRGYALSWMEWSVEELIEIGWLKLKESK